ncbi:MAG: sulfopyruvate decarboxylase subunit beta [Betaproteobacteria bacterium]|nr:sulfopyruvate decarboxylase subunit beta [Betaproteobacteria bacterium]
MRTSECFRLLAKRRNKELVVCTLGTATSEWHAITQDDRAFHMHAMGIAASFALGLALARPKTPVWLLDSDGGLAMSLGALLAEARHCPANLIHFVVDNGSYQIIGGYPVVHAGRGDFAALAKAAGMERSYRFSELADYEAKLDGILACGQHTFVSLTVKAEPPPRVPVPFEGPEIKYRFARHIERQEGISVFGPYGY